MLLENQDIIFFDIESTGTSTTKDRIVELSAIKTNQDFKILDKKKIVVNPTIPIPKEASAVHGFTDDFVKDLQPFSKYAKAVFAFFSGCALAGFNIRKFDIPLLSEEFNRCELDFDVNVPILDSYVIFAENEPRTLSAAAKFYCGDDGVKGGAHNAENDNLQTIEVTESQMFFYGYDINQAFTFCKETWDKKRFLDFAGKIVLNEEGIAVYSFGKDNGKSVKQFPGFGDWMLRNDFPKNTKDVVRSLIYSK